MDIYNLDIQNTDGDIISLSDYKGKVLLIVNTATACGFTPQYEGLQCLYEKYRDLGFEILDFPCNQFGGQAPGSNEEIAHFCALKYKTTFKTFAKVDVNGENTHPLFNYLKKNAPGFLGGFIKWNFTKFLVDRGGNVVKRFAPMMPPSKIDKYIAQLIS